MPEAFGFSVPTQIEQLADPSRAAVIIYDMQVGIISQIAEGLRSSRSAQNWLQQRVKAVIGYPRCLHQTAF